MTQTIIQPFLLFFGQAEEAMNFYVSLFPGAKVLDLIRYGPNEPGKEASVKKARFSIGSQIVLCIDSTVKHEFSLTPAFSFLVEYQSDREIIQLYDALASGGSTPMPLRAYDFSQKFAWVNDRFGVSWQLSLA
jgi:predicted 3-demethylubiquinone-9 3-methyltransferase (glyoxalase superfamily)